MNEWQPIETAPKAGNRLFAFAAFFIGWVLGVVSFAPVYGQHIDEWQNIANENFWAVCPFYGSISVTEQNNRRSYDCYLGDAKKLIRLPAQAIRAVKEKQP